MNPEFPSKEEYLGGPSFSSSLWQPIQQPHEAAPPPQPMDRLQEMGPPPFLTKTFDMVDNSAIDQIVSWSRGGCSFVVWDPHAFSTSVLPSYFKHNNFSSFVRQLNTYGFRKIDPDKLEYANEGFIRGQKHLLKNIRRRKASPQHLPPEPEQAIGRDAEINQLRRDKQVLIMEIVKLRQQQQSIRSCLNQMELKLRGTEKKQKKMMNFLARAMQNPELFQKLLWQKEKREEVEETRRRPGPSDEPSGINQGPNLVSTQPLEFDNSYLSQLSELEALALEMQGFGKARREREEDQDEIEQIGNPNKDSGKSF